MKYKKHKKMDSYSSISSNTNSKQNFNDSFTNKKASDKKQSRLKYKEAKTPNRYESNIKSFLKKT